MQHIFTATLESANSKLFNWQLRIPDPITTAFLSSPTKRRVVCALNGQEVHQCALTPIGEGVYIIKVNQGRMKKLGLMEGSRVELTLFPDNSEYGLPMPEELMAAMEEDTEGRKLLHALSIGKIRTLLYIAGQGKNSDQRLWRAVRILEHLKIRSGKVNYKALNEEIKTSI